MSTLFALLLAAVLAGGCQRDPTTGAPQAGTATHPWELPNWNVALQQPQPAVEEPDTGAPASAVETPTLRGPALSEQDTLDPTVLPGLWLQVCLVQKEIMNLLPVEEMDVLEMRTNGSAVFNLVHQGEATRVEGTWRKTAPGQFGLSFNNEPEVSFFAEIYGTDFLYFWSYDSQVGMWFARLPQDSAQQIAANRFDTTRGELVFNNVVGLSYDGVLHAQNEIDLRGMYTHGVMTMRWEDQQGHLGGFAAFIVDPQWQTLNGVWWIDDYEAAPFGGAWTGTSETAAE